MAIAIFSCWYVKFFCVLDINSLLVVDILNIPSHLVIFLLILYVIPSLSIKPYLLNSNSSFHSFFAFWFMISKFVLKKVFLTHVKRCVPTFSLIGLIFSFTFKLVIWHLALYMIFHKDPVLFLSIWRVFTPISKLSIPFLFDLWCQLYCRSGLSIWALSLSSLLPRSVCSWVHTSLVLLWWLWGRS